MAILSFPFSARRRPVPDRQAPPTDAVADGAGADDAIDTQAIVWHVRLRGTGMVDHAAFEAWLAEDERHRRAFADIRSGDDTPDGHMRAERHGTVGESPQGRWWAGGAVAATVAVLAVVGLHRTADPFDVSTAAGERRVVALDAGTVVTLNGGTRMRFDRRDPRVATLVSGEALFHVRHDAARPFRLSVAGRQVEDVGTVFDVASDAEAVRVSVGEGSVVYNPGREGVALRPGQGLVDARTASAIRLVDVPAGSVGGWARGQFAYDGQPLAQVAADLSRALGVRVAAAPAIAGRSFSGGIALDVQGGRTGRAEQLARLAPALDVRLERRPDGWIMMPEHGAPR